MSEAPFSQSIPSFIHPIRRSHLSPRRHHHTQTVLYPLPCRTVVLFHTCFSPLLSPCPIFRTVFPPFPAKPPLKPNAREEESSFLPMQATALLHLHRPQLILSLSHRGESERRGGLSYLRRNFFLLIFPPEILFCIARYVFAISSHT